MRTIYLAAAVFAAALLAVPVSAGEGMPAGSLLDGWTKVGASGRVYSWRPGGC
jgi:hypothetical protein